MFEREERLIVRLRLERRLGIKQLRSELIRRHDLRLSLETVHKVLERHGVNVLERKRSWRKRSKRYVRPVSGDRVLMDVCQIAPALYPYTAIDDCSRYKVLGLIRAARPRTPLTSLSRCLRRCLSPYSGSRRTVAASSSPARSSNASCEWAIKFRPIKPRSPHLNGKGKRSQKTDLQEFWSTVALKAVDLQQQLDEWRHFYNWHRPHTALNGRSPIDRVCDLLSKTPLPEDVYAAFEPTKERIRDQNYVMDQKLHELK